MNERKNAVTMKGQPLTLVGPELRPGQKAPAFAVLANDLSTVRLSDFQGKVRIICSVPSLDTSVCDTEARKFNEAAAGLGPDVAVLVISMDLPFAQARWCGAGDVKNIKTLSDHRDAAFGAVFGVLIKELRLLARAVFVIDKAGTIKYIELVKELTKEPNYDAALKAAKGLI